MSHQHAPRDHRYDDGDGPAREAEPWRPAPGRVTLTMRAQAGGTAPGAAPLPGKRSLASYLDRPRVEPLEDDIRRVVERTTGVALGDVQVHHGAAMSSSGRLAEVIDGAIFLGDEVPDAADPLGRRVRLHEAMHVAQTRATGAPGDPAAVEADAHAATAAAERGEPYQPGVRAAAGVAYGFDLGEAGAALGDPMAWLRAQAPQLAHFVSSGLEPLLQRLGDAAGGAVRDALDAVGADGLRDAFDALLVSFQPGGNGFGILHGCCECLEHVLHDLQGGLDTALQSDSAESVRTWVAETQETAGEHTIDALDDFFTVLHGVGGPVLAGIEAVGHLIAEARRTLGDLADRAWRAIAPRLGLDPHLPPVEAIKKRLSELWQDVVRRLQPLRQAMAAAWATLRTNPVVAKILAFTDDARRLIAAIRAVRETRSRDPQVWLGILARELRGTVFEELIAGLQTGYTSALALRDRAGAWIHELLESMGLLAAWREALPVLRAIGGVIGGFVQRMQARLGAIQLAMHGALTALSQQLHDLWQEIEPYVSFVVGLGVAIGLTLGGDLWALPRFFASQLWLHVVPHCYKAPLADFLLSVFIRVVDWVPAIHPLVILVRSTVLSFLGTLRAAAPETKTDAMDNVARLLSGNAAMLAGFVVGAVEGLWNSSLGSIVQLVLSPLQLGWQALTWLIDGFAGLSGQPAQPQPGDAAQRGAAAEPVRTTVDVEPSADAAPSDEEPEGEVAAAPTSPAPRPAAAASPAAAAATAPAVEPAPPAPDLPPLRSLLDQALRTGVTREDVESLFQRFGVAMGDLGSRAGASAAEAILPMLAAQDTPYVVGEAVGRVVGWLAGELILFVFTEGIGNAVGELSSGARAMAFITENFPRLAAWLRELRAGLEPVFAAFERLHEAIGEVMAKIRAWLQELIAWAERQVARLGAWLEEAAPSARRALERAGRWLAGNATDLELEAEAQVAAAEAWRELEVMLLGSVHSHTDVETKLAAVVVTHTPDVRMTLAVHELGPWRWGVRATATKGGNVEHAHHGLGAVMTTSPPGARYYALASHTVEHEAIIEGAYQQIIREGSIGAEVETLHMQYAQKAAVAAQAQLEGQQALPLHGTTFRIELEPESSYDVQHDHVSQTRFTIAPNTTTRTKPVRIRGLTHYLGAQQGPAQDQFEGSFDVGWNWAGWPLGPISRHPINDALGLRDAATTSELQPSGNYVAPRGGTSPGRAAINDKVANWRTSLDDRARRKTDHYVATGLPRGQARLKALRDIEDEYVAQHYPRHPFHVLKVIGETGWWCHHVHPYAWFPVTRGGLNDLTNLTYISTYDHEAISAWFNRRSTLIKERLGIT